MRHCSQLWMPVGVHLDGLAPVGGRATSGGEGRRRERFAKMREELASRRRSSTPVERTSSCSSSIKRMKARDNGESRLAIQIEMELLESITTLGDMLDALEQRLEGKAERHAP